MESTLWMGDVEPWMSRELILKSFFEYGLKPSSIKMLKDHKYNISRNYCFINFETMAEANKALIELNGKKIPNTNINFRLNWANKHCEMNRNLYVGNLSSDIDDITLFDIFKSKYPSIHHVSIMTDKGESKGYGFIQFIDKYDYDKCLREMDGYIIKGKPIIVRERIKKNSEERNKNINNKYNKLDLNMNSNSDIVYKQYKNNDLYGINMYKESKSDFFYQYSNNNMNSLLKQKDEDDDDLSSSNSSTSNSEKRKFSDNLDMIVNDDHIVLSKKIQESVDKMFEHYKFITKNSDVLKMIIYYGSNNCPFSDNLYF
jgi:RNA recognition motif-containing protein